MLNKQYHMVRKLVIDYQSIHQDISKQVHLFFCLHMQSIYYWYTNHIYNHIQDNFQKHHLHNNNQGINKLLQTYFLYILNKNLLYQHKFHIYVNMVNNQVIQLQKILFYKHIKVSFSFLMHNMYYNQRLIMNMQHIKDYMLM